jgi:hypothetical protein
MEDRTDAPLCWKSESILVSVGKGREPINIAPYLVDKQDENATIRRDQGRLEFPVDVYPASWDNRKIIEDAVKTAVAEADNINLISYGTTPNSKIHLRD